METPLVGSWQMGTSVIQGGHWGATIELWMPHNWGAGHWGTPIGGSLETPEIRGVLGGGGGVVGR